MRTLSSAVPSLSLVTVALLAGACSGGASDANEVARQAAPVVTAAAPRERDLAIILDRADPNLVLASAKLSGSTALLQAAWVRSVSAAYAQTSVGETLDTENRYGDWRVVSLRVAPCSPLGPTPTSDIDHLCWPEVRLVFQPLVYKVRIHERYADAFADDRAIHALYDVAPELVLSTMEASRARALVARVRTAAAATPFAPLSAAERNELEGLRDRVTTALLADTLALRGPFADEAFTGLGVRPESLDGGAQAVALGQRLKVFLGRMAAPANLRALTSFSLPEGREPAHLDEWVFLSFQARGGVLVQDDVTITSAKDGRSLAALGKAHRASQTRDDDALYELVDNEPELRDSVVLGPRDAARLGARLADRRTHLVPNTSCASCHKLNALRFDFHNMSYLEDRDVTLSPRVRQDVALDLAWVASHHD